jgi:hypothetical protein
METNMTPNASHPVDAARPKGWAPIPTTTVPEAIHLDAVLRALWAPETTSWISPDGRHYVVPGRHSAQAVVDIWEGGPNEWVCSCDQAHEVTANDKLCDAIIQVAILRGDFVRRKER